MRCGVSDAKAGARRFCTGRTAKAASGGRCSLSPSSLPLTHGVSAFGPRAVGSSFFGPAGVGASPRAVCAAATWWLVDLAQSILVVPFMDAKTKLLIAAIALIVLLGMFLSALVAFSGRPTN